MEKKRIAVGAILTECNHLGGMPIDLDWFERYELRRGPQLLEAENGVLGGMLDVFNRRNIGIEPLIFASTCPGGPLTAACYQQLKAELLERLQQVLPVDGVALPLHGAAAAEGAGDLEGDLVEAVRQLVGAQVPIVATLDLHAHISAAMVQHTDALVAWETYPHRDAFSTGARGAKILADTVEGLCRPTMAMAKVPVIASGIHGGTEGDGPFARVMRRAKEFEKEAGVLSTSAILVHPYLNLPGMGSGGLVVTDNNQGRAEDLARELARLYWDSREEFEPEVFTPEQAIARGLGLEGGPVVLVETADCCGGGAAGDSVASLAALLRQAPAEHSLVPVVDAEAAALCQRAGVGGEVALKLGHKHDKRWGEPLAVEGRVLRLCDGRFRYSGGIWDGVEGNMGPSAILQLGAIEVLVTTYGTYDWRDEQFKAAGMEPEKAKFVVAKNPMNFTQTYGDIAAAMLVLDTPGPTPATMRHAPLAQIERPYFPADPEMELAEITLLK